MGVLLLTGPEAGITRDAISVTADYLGTPMRIFDTAGMRKRAKVVDKLEKLSVADALRAPFIAMTPTHPNHRYKWDDWAKSVDLPMRAIKPILSSPTDVYVRFTGRWGEAKRSKAILTHPLMTPVATAITYIAAENMRRIVKKTEPQLSSDATISRLTERSLEAVERFVKTHS